MMAVRLLPPVLLVVVLAACGSRSQTSLTARAGDCYDLVAGSWSVVDSAVGGGPTPTPDLTDDSLYYSLPVRVRLEETLARGSSEIRVMRVPQDALPVPHGILLWRGGRDTLRLLVSTGHAGTETVLAPDGGVWAGRATTFDDDDSRPRFDRPVRLEPTDCESPPPVPATADRPLLRRIELDSGDVLALGQAAPAGLPAAVGTVEVQADAVAPFHGTERILAVLTPDNVVMRIELQYGDGHDFTPIMRALLEAEPGLRSSSLGGTSRVWMNRTTRVHLQRTGIPRLMLYDPRLWPYGFAAEEGS